MTPNRTIRRCLACGYPTDANTRIGGDKWEAPDDGAVSICISCGNIAIFDGPGFRWPTREELDDILKIPAVVISKTFIQLRGPIVEK
jgi:hypothetical protein